MYITGNISVICALAASPINTPTNAGVIVAITELKEPPTWINWLPLFPPPPKVLSIGFTTVFNNVIEKPATNAPKR